VTPYWSDGTCTLLAGDALEVLRGMPDGSVNCAVTSPPYFGLRDYGTEGQIGLEDSPAAYVERLCKVFGEVRRVLADDGTLWLNIGDSYANPAGSGPQGNGQRADRAFTAESVRPVRELPAKNLLMIPARVALALQADGWIVRSEIIWAKRNLMPEAVTDRPTRAHEHVYLLSKRPRYWFDADAIREESTSPEQEAHNQRYAREYEKHSVRAAVSGQPGNVNSVGVHSRPGTGGRNARDVWSISQTPNPQAHFATFPVELPLRCISAGCKPGGTVLDPFSGSGTTGEACRRLGRKYTGIDLNPAYHDLAIRRYAQGVIDFTEAAI
jgi:DNA modification methylase